MVQICISIACPQSELCVFNAIKLDVQVRPVFADLVTYYCIHDIGYVCNFQEAVDSPQLIRYYLTASYNFMPVSETQSTAITSTDNSTNDKETVYNLQSSSTCEIQFPAAPYHTRNECDFSKKHSISDLTTFQGWLKEGLTVKVHLQKAIFVKEDQSTTMTSSRPSSTTRPSSSKKEKPREKVSLML